MNSSFYKNLTIIACITLLAASFPSCKNKEKEISHIQTTQTTYYSYYIYEEAKSYLHYKSGSLDIQLDTQLLPCEQVVKTIPEEVSYNLTTDPWDYLTKDVQTELQASHRSIYENDENELDYYEQELYKDYNYWQSQMQQKSKFPTQNIATPLSILDSYSLYYTYSEKYNARLYMSVTMNFSYKKTVSAKISDDICTITYYSYERNENKELIFSKKVIKTPLSQVISIYYV